MVRDRRQPPDDCRAVPRGLGLTGKIKHYPHIDATGLRNATQRLKRLLLGKPGPQVVWTGTAKDGWRRDNTGHASFRPYPYDPKDSIEDKIEGLAQAQRELSDVIDKAKVDIREEARKSERESRERVNRVQYQLNRRIKDREALEDAILRFHLPRELWGMCMALLGAITTASASFLGAVL